jgi:hypothetical protein
MHSKPDAGEVKIKWADRIMNYEVFKGRKKKECKKIYATYG